MDTSSFLRRPPRRVAAPANEKSSRGKAITRLRRENPKLYERFESGEITLERAMLGRLSFP
jgi:hypothetical protein